MDAAVEELKKGRSIALAVVVKKSGSAPRDIGAKMLVRGDGSTIGTLRGSFERMVREEALKTLKEGKASLKKYVFREDAEDSE